LQRFPHEGTERLTLASRQAARTVVQVRREKKLRSMHDVWGLARMMYGVNGVLALLDHRRGLIHPPSESEWRGR
jgi:hypothetical protein